MSNYDIEKKVHVIVHGQKNLFDSIKTKISSLGFKDDQIAIADINKPGNVGEYVAMIWPPMAAKEIILSQITGFDGSGSGGMGAWSKVNRKELERLPLD